MKSYKDKDARGYQKQESQARKSKSGKLGFKEWSNKWAWSSGRSCACEMTCRNKPLKGLQVDDS